MRTSLIILLHIRENKMVEKKKRVHKGFNSKLYIHQVKRNLDIGGFLCCCWDYSVFFCKAIIWELYRVDIVDMRWREEGLSFFLFFCCHFLSVFLKFVYIKCWLNANVVVYNVCILRLISNPQYQHCLLNAMTCQPYLTSYCCCWLIAAVVGCY